ncbi:hypothetical protein EDM52_14380 [Brevibacillus invocatus]|uniref:Uncharacterized protein n=1 Tax=Brevibacillus invocatus TaxID=173959 RepID=A0A3M8C8H6_9BACL|nr:hypothetical protein EDM52_14380 [Brevibacillus invocatus]
MRERNQIKKLSSSDSILVSNMKFQTIGDQRPYRHIPFTSRPSLYQGDILSTVRTDPTAQVTTTIGMLFTVLTPFLQQATSPPPAFPHSIKMDTRKGIGEQSHFF